MSFNELNFKKLVSKNAWTDPSKKKKSLRRLRDEFQKRYKAGEKKWFFSKLRVRYTLRAAGGCAVFVAVSLLLAFCLFLLCACVCECVVCECE